MRLAPVALVAAGVLAGGCQKPAPPGPPPGGPAMVGPDFAPPAEAADEGPLPDDLRQDPIPQDLERMAKVRAERLARARASTVEAYARVGSRNPKWDQAA